MRDINLAPGTALHWTRGQGSGLWLLTPFATKYAKAIQALAHLYWKKRGIRNHLFTLAQILVFPLMDHFRECQDLFDDSSCLLVKGTAPSKPFLSKGVSQPMAGSSVLPLMQTGMWSTCNTVGFTTSVVIYALSVLTVPHWAGGNWKVFSVSVFEANQRNIMFFLFECSFLIEVEFLEAFLLTAIYKMQFSMKHVTMHQ